MQSKFHKTQDRACEYYSGVIIETEISRFWIGVAYVHACE